MASEASKLYELIYDMGTGLVIGKVSLDVIKEQDINARIMKKDMQDQLTANIKKRGQLESLPYLALKDNCLEIISGHHRIKSARAAGIKVIIAIIDISGLSRSKVVAKQLAHNAISGFDDQDTLREICKMLEDVDDMLESFIGKDILQEPLDKYDKMMTPAVTFDWKNVTFSFLPHQLKDLDAFVKSLELSAPDIIGVAGFEQCKAFVDVLSKYQKFADVRNVGAAIHSMVQSAMTRMEDCGFDDSGDWTYLTKVFGSNAIPATSADVMKRAIKKAEKEGVVTSKNRGDLITILCERYVNGT